MIRKHDDIQDNFEISSVHESVPEGARSIGFFCVREIVFIFHEYQGMLLFVSD
jgi:hypothetical protein